MKILSFLLCLLFVTGTLFPATFTLEDVNIIHGFSPNEVYLPYELPEPFEFTVDTSKTFQVCLQAIDNFDGIEFTLVCDDTTLMIPDSLFKRGDLFDGKGIANAVKIQGRNAMKFAASVFTSGESLTANKFIILAEFEIYKVTLPDNTNVFIIRQKQ